MQKTTIILAAVAASLALVPAFAQVPNLNIEKTCRAAQPLLGPDENNKTEEGSKLGNTNDNNTYKNCMQSENAAKKSSQEIWSKVRAADRSNCVGLSRMVYPSYVELLSCLQMYEPNALGTTSAGQATPRARTPNRRP